MIKSAWIFQIPQSNKKALFKDWWWSAVVKFYDEWNFEIKRRSIIQKIDNMVSVSTQTKAIKNPEDRSFFKVSLNPSAISKSSQPIKLFKESNIDILWQIDDFDFIGTAKSVNLQWFRDKISMINIDSHRNDCAYLSSIDDISLFSQSDKLIWFWESIEGDNKSFIYLYNNLSDQTCQSIYENLPKTIKQNSEYFVANSWSKIIYWLFPSDFLNEISKPYPESPFEKVEKSIEFTVQQSQPTTIDFSDIEIIDWELDAKVWVFDTWVTSNNFLKDYVIATEDFIKDVSLEDNNHWTMVSSRIVFGHSIYSDLTKEKKLYAHSKVLDIKVLKKIGWSVSVSDKDLIDTVKDVLVKYSETIKVYNLSLNNSDNEIIAEGRKHYLTRELDTLAYQYDVLFVVSAWNQWEFVKKWYINWLKCDESTITPPADVFNWISVGSIADSDSSRSLCKSGEPSPFTRHGVNWFKKPDLIHYWWNTDAVWNCSWIWVYWIWIDVNSVVENVWTSFAAPIVSQIASQLHAFLETTWIDVSASLLKWLLLHSWRYNLPSHSVIDSTTASLLCWYWIPDFWSAINSITSMVTFIYQDKIWWVETIAIWKNTWVSKRAKKQRISFSVPNELAWKDKKIRVRWTLVYTAPVSISGDFDYLDSNIDINLYYNNTKWKQNSWQLTSWTDDYRIKWNNTKSFEVSYTAFESWEWEIWLDLLTRWDSDQDTFGQDYALIITIEDISKESRVDLHQIIEARYKQYTPITQKIKVR